VLEIDREGANAASVDLSPQDTKELLSGVAPTEGARRARSLLWMPASHNHGSGSSTSQSTAALPQAPMNKSLIRSIIKSREAQTTKSR